MPPPGHKNVNKEAVIVLSSKPQWNGCRVRIMSPIQGSLRHTVEGSSPDGSGTFRSNVSLLNLYVPPVMQEMKAANSLPESVPVALHPYGAGTDKEIFVSLDDLSFPLGVRQYCLALDKGLEWKPMPDGDGKTRLWGLDPQPTAAGHFKTDAAMILGARSGDGVMYPDSGKPEVQLAAKLGAAKLALIASCKKARRAIHRKEFILKISLQRTSPEIFRLVRASGSTSLRTLQDKIISPAMGWARSYHGYYYTDLSDGTLFGNETAGKGVDSTLMKHYHGHKFIDDREVLLGDLVEKVGDELEYVYDLGVRWEHSITVQEVREARRSGVQESVMPAPTCQADLDPRTPSGMMRMLERMQMQGTRPPGSPHIAIVCVGGDGACPPEDGNGTRDERACILSTSFEPTTGTMSMDSFWTELSGNDVYSRAIAPGGILVTRGHKDYTKEHVNALKSSNYEKVEHDMGNTFQPRLFDLSIMNARVCDALNMGCECEECKEANAAHWRDRRATSVCEQCLLAAPKLKACGRCELVFYCCRECQLQHWDVHKTVCKKKK